MSNQQTYFGSLENYQKGGVEVIDDNPKNYAFSNVFEVASKSKPYEKVAVGKNLKYVIEALRAEGTPPGSPRLTTRPPSRWMATSRCTT